MQSAMVFTLVVCWCVALLVSGFPALESRGVKGKGKGGKGKHSGSRTQADRPRNGLCRYELTEASQDNIGDFKNDTRAVKLITSQDACYVMEGKKRCRQTQLTSANETSTLPNLKGGERVALVGLTDRLTEACQDRVIFRVSVVHDGDSGTGNQQS